MTKLPSLKLVVKPFIKGNHLAFDTETTGLKPFHGDKPFAFSFCNRQGETWYWEFPVFPQTRTVMYDTTPEDSRAYRAISEVLANEKIGKVGHNIKFDVRMANSAGMTVKGILDDTMFMAHACNTSEMSYGLKQLAQRYGAVDKEDQDRLLASVKKLRLKLKKTDWKLAFDRVIRHDGTIKLKSAIPADYWLPRAVKFYRPDLFKPEYEGLCEEYAVQDAVRTMLLDQFYSPLMQQTGVYHTYKHEMYGLWEAVFDMENRGVHFDREKNKAEGVECSEKIKKYYKLVEKDSWPGINLDSPKQMRKLLYDKLKLPRSAERVTESGLPSVDSDALRDHAGHPVVDNVLKHRSNVKAYGSFFANYQAYAVPDHITDGHWCLIGNFRQVGQRTARFSCGEPNLQQVTSIESSRSADPVDARGPFGPRPGYVWLHIDFKGMEVRVFADCAQEPNMLKAIADGREIHDEVANRGWGGKDNQAGIKECIHSLGLDGSELGKEKADILIQWKKWGLKKEDDWKKLTERNKVELISDWMEGFNWDIVKAQSSVKRKVTKNKSKMVTFCKVYGGGAAAIKDLLHVSLEDAKEFLDQYNTAFPRITEYQYEMTYLAKQQGYIKSRWDRRLSVDRDFAYKATNYMVQGSSADLLKSGMVKCHKFLKSSGLDAHMIMTIHDELVFEVNKNCFTTKLVRSLSRLMEDHEGHLGVTMPTDPSYVVGSWANKIKLEI